MNHAKDNLNKEFLEAFEDPNVKKFLKEQDLKYEKEMCEKYSDLKAN